MTLNRNIREKIKNGQLITEQMVIFRTQLGIRRKINANQNCMKVRVQIGIFVYMHISL
jgi:hypothetical protein